MRRILSTLAAVIASTAAAHAEEIWLTMDYVQPYELSKPAGQIIVGNPGIADVTVRDDSNILLFGKGPGITNLFVFDKDGEKLANLIVRVRALGDRMLTVQRGAERTTFNCMTQCEATITVGDSNDSFLATATQVQQKFQSAVQTAAGAQQQ